MPRLVLTKGDTFRKELAFTDADADIVMIGRAQTNDIVLPDPSRRVSRYHAAIVRAPGPGERYFIRDLGSFRSTKVEGEVVYQKLLQDGDKIEIVDYELSYYSRAAVHEEVEEEEELIVVVPKKGEVVAEKSTVLFTHQELLKEIPLAPERREVVKDLHYGKPRDDRQSQDAE